MVILKYKKSGKVLKLWHVNANSVDIMRLNILSWGLLTPLVLPGLKCHPIHTGIHKDPSIGTQT